MRIVKAYDVEQIIQSSLLIVLYSATLFVVLRGSKFKLIIQIISLLLVSNVASILVSVANTKIVGFEQAGLPGWDQTWVWVQVIATFFRDSTFNVSHWMFTFEYFKISKFMPSVIEDS